MPSKGSLEVHCTFARFTFHNSRLIQDSAFCVLQNLNATSQETATNEIRLAVEYLKLTTLYQYLQNKF